jgi:Secretion system C-terminal sorting domain
MTIRIMIFFFIVCACFNLHAQTNIITTIAGDGTQGYGGDGGPATSAKFNHADFLWLHKGSLYITDAFNHRIRKIDLTTNIISTVAGTGVAGYNGDNIAATNAQLQVPEGICLDTAGNMYISDGYNRRVRKVTASTGIITTIAGNGTIGHSGDGGAATNAQLGGPWGVFIDKNNNVYICDGIENNIRKVSSAGIISTIAGTGVAGYSGNGGPATNAQVNTPAMIATDSSGNIIFSDGSNHAIRKIDAITAVITTIAGNGSYGYLGDGGPAFNALLYYPAGIFVDGHNNIFLADALNYVVRKIDGVSGIISTVVGSGISGFSGDGGPATSANLNIPDGIFLDSFGTMFITDYKYNNRVRMVYNPQLSIPKEPAQVAHVDIYPNPAKNEIIIEYNFDSNEDGVLQIADMMGRLLITKNLSIQKQKEGIDIEHLSQGVYLYRVVQGGVQISAGRIIKE